MIDSLELAALAIRVAGGQGALAKALGLSQATVFHWSKSGVSDKHYLTVYDYVKDAGRLDMLTGGDK